MTTKYMAEGIRLSVERRIWFCIWLYALVFHLVATPWMYQVWWRIGYKWVYPYMMRAKQEGREFAQPYGGGFEAIYAYLRRAKIEAAHDYFRRSKRSPHSLNRQHSPKP